MLLNQTVSAQNDSTPFTATSTTYSSVTRSSNFVSFNSIINHKKVLLNWTVTQNQDTDRFEIERSVDGKKFVFAAMVFGSDREGLDTYQFYEKLKRSKVYYRVKTVAKDGSLTYSKIIEAGS